MDASFSLVVFVAAVAAFAAYRSCISAFSDPEDLKRERNEKKQTARPKSSLRNTFAKLADAINDIVPLAKADSVEYREKLIGAGIKVQAETWHGAMLLAVIGGTLAGLLAGLTNEVSLESIVPIVIGGAVGWAAPRFYLHLRTEQRKQLIERSLPDALDLLAITVQAGSTPERGFKQIAAKCTGPIAEEFAQVDREINVLNTDRAEALGRMARRCQSREVSMFCSAVVQAMRQGSSITKVLEGQAQLARKKWYDSMEEKANKIPTKMVIPLAAIFVPCMGIACVSPFVYVVINSFMGAVG